MLSAPSDIHRAIGDDRKGKLSLVAYVAAFALAFVVPWVSIGLLVAVAVGAVVAGFVVD